jgi:hypothetical protein
VLGLSRRTRARLAFNHLVDGAAIALLNAGFERTAMALWRATGALKRPPDS